MSRLYVREMLEKKTVKWLRSECKRYGINVYTHKRSLTKSELMEKLLSINVFMYEIKSNIKCGKDGKMDIKTINRSNRGLHDNGKIRNFDYGNMAVGSFIAFRYKGRSDTAKVFAINRKQRLVKAETKLGTQYLVPFERIVWVKLHPEDLWPKTVLMELKGHNKCSWEGVDGEPYGESKRSVSEIVPC